MPNSLRSYFRDHQWVTMGRGGGQLLWMPKPKNQAQPNNRAQNTTYASALSQTRVESVREATFDHLSKYSSVTNKPKKKPYLTQGMIAYKKRTDMGGSYTDEPYSDLDISSIHQLSLKFQKKSS